MQQCRSHYPSCFISYAYREKEWVSIRTSKIPSKNYLLLETLKQLQMLHWWYLLKLKIHSSHKQNKNKEKKHNERSTQTIWPIIYILFLAGVLTIRLFCFLRTKTKPVSSKIVIILLFIDNLLFIVFIILFEHTVYFFIVNLHLCVNTMKPFGDQTLNEM